VENKDRQRIIRALRDIVVGRRDQDVPTVLAALRVQLDELDKIDPPKAERKTRETRDRQETAGRDRGVA
jgi:hypothetical protein